MSLHNADLLRDIFQAPRYCAETVLPGPAIASARVGQHDRPMPVKPACWVAGKPLSGETRHWLEWAEFLGVPAMTLFTAIGVIMERGESLRRVFDIFKPGMDPGLARRMRAATGWTYDFTLADLYPDVIPCLTDLRERGYKVLIAGNQPVESEAALARLNVPADVIASSGGWGIAKPDPAFFAKVIEVAGEPAESIAY